MKKVFTLMCVAAMAAWMSNFAQAQDFSSLEGSDYHVIWLDSDTEVEFEITDKIVQDLRVTWDATNNPDGAIALYIWENQWAGVEANGLGAFGQVGGFLNFNKLLGWAGLGLCMRDNAPTSFDVDYTSMTDDYRFHMATRSASSGKSFGIELTGQTSAAAKFAVGSPTVDPAGYSPNLTPNFVADGITWNIIDIPVSQLKEYGFQNRGTFRGNFLNIISPDQGTGSNIAIDAIFFYKPKSNVGVVSPQKDTQLQVQVTDRIVQVTNATAPIEVYSLTGVKVKTSNEPVFGVEELNKGVYVIKSGAAVAKVIVK